jgi:hypothetical protein
MEESGFASNPGRLSPDDSSSNQWMGVWVGFRAGFDAVEKRKISFLCQKS